MDPILAGDKLSTPDQVGLPDIEDGADFTCTVTALIRHVDYLRVARTRNLKIGHYKKIGMEKRKPTAGKGDGIGC